MGGFVLVVLPVRTGPPSGVRGGARAMKPPVGDGRLSTRGVRDPGFVRDGAEWRLCA